MAVKKLVNSSVNESANDYDDKFFVFDIGDSEEGTIDRYTIILRADVDGEPDRRGFIPALASGEDPKGFMQHVDVLQSDVVDSVSGGEQFLGEEIPFSSLPDAVQQFAISDYQEQLDGITEADKDPMDDEGEDDEADLSKEDGDESDELDDQPEDDKEGKITVVVISPELKKDEDEDDENQDAYDLENKDLINTNEHVQALFNGETLSEDFQEKAKVVFEAALAEHTKALRNKFIKEFRIRESKIKAKFDSQVQAIQESLIKEQGKLVDGYLSEAVDTWVKENQMVLESNIRTELTEEFIDGLKNLFTESYIEVPVEKFDLIKAQETKIKELEESLAVEKRTSRKSLKESKRLHCESVIAKLTSEMTEVEKAKFVKLVESVDFDSIEQFERKVKTLKESYTKKSTLRETKVENRNTRVETEVTLDESNLIDNPMDQISAALGSVFSTK